MRTILIALMLSAGLAMAGISTGPQSGSVGGIPNVTSGANYVLYSTITVSNSTLFPFLNSSNWIYVPTNGCYVKNGQPGGTNFFYYDPTFNAAWVFATNRFPTSGTDGIFEWDQDASQIFSVNQYSINGFVRASDSAADATKIFAPTVANRTNLTVAGMDTTIGISGLQDIPGGALSVSNLSLMAPMVRLSQAGSMSSTFGTLNFYGNSFGYPWTNSSQGFEIAKIAGRAIGSPRSDDRVFSIVPYYKGNIGEFGGGLDFLVSRSSTYPTPNNQYASSWLTGGWPWIRVLNIQNMGVEAGDCPTGDHEYGRWLPAWFVVYNSTNDRPYVLMTNQIPTGTDKQYKTNVLPAGAQYTDNTNMFIGGNICIPTNASAFNPVKGQVKFAISNNWLFVITPFVTNPVVKVMP